MEIQLQLDGNGRTTWARLSSESEAESNDSAAAASAIDFSSKTTMMSLVPPTPPADNSVTNESAQDDDEWRTWMDNILFDCEISDCGLMPRTFWMPADGTEPRCALEQLALDVFHHHVPSNCSFDPTTSGAEWWVQIRPSPPGIGRYSMHDTQPDSLSQTGISFHWDKDEDLRLLAGGNLYVHPYLSTVTYLTDLGAPTMVVNCRINTVTGEWMVPEDSVEAFVSWPKAGKHLSFDGQLLHAAPPDLMQEGVFAQQCKISDDELNAISSGGDAKEVERRRKILERRHRRVTFLVNIWLNYKPFNVELFPETMLDKLTKADESKWNGMFVKSSTVDASQIVNEQHVTVRDGEVQAKETSSSECDNVEKAQAFTWPMGDCDSGETIEMKMPLQSIRNEAAEGGNVRIEWRRDDKGSVGVCLRKDAKPSAEEADTKVTAKHDGKGADTRTSTDDDESRSSSAKRMKVDSNDNNTS